MIRVNLPSFTDFATDVDELFTQIAAKFKAGGLDIEDAEARLYAIYQAEVTMRLLYMAAADDPELMKTVSAAHMEAAEISYKGLLGYKAKTPWPPPLGATPLAPTPTTDNPKAKEAHGFGTYL